MRICRSCRCTDFEPCVFEDGSTCCWIEEDLCSACAVEVTACFAGGERLAVGYVSAGELEAAEEPALILPRDYTPEEHAEAERLYREACR